MADAQASGACGRKIVWVQVPSPALIRQLYRMSGSYEMQEWRNWQTRRLQVPVVARSCGFKSHLLHSFFAKNILYPSKLFQSKIPGFSEQFQNSRDFIVTIHSVHSNLVKMHSKSPSVIAFCPVCLGILPYSWQNTSRDITCEQLHFIYSFFTESSVI